jgi:hypothetical protein
MADDDREPQSACEALQQAVVNLLRKDEPLKAMVGERIFDEVPADNDPVSGDFVYVGAVNLSRIELGCAAGWRARMRLFVTATGFGRLKVWAVVERMVTLLDGSEPRLNGPYKRLDRITVQQQGDAIEPIDPKSAFIDLATTIAAN